MDHKAAIAAACDGVRNHEAKIDGISIGPDGHCTAADWLRNFQRGAGPTWIANADGFWCLPWGGANIFLDLDKNDGHLERIAAYCQNTFDP
jgi:hypothetical protein